MTLLTNASLGVGLAAVGRPAYITSGRSSDLGEHRNVEAMRARAFALLDTAAELGVDYLDAARSYGRAEEFLAAWLNVHPETTAEVGSKWGYRYVGGWRLDAEVHEVKDHSLEAFLEQRDATLALLGRWLSVYHVHSATLETGVLTDAPLHRHLAELRERGVRIGVSTSGPQQAEAVRRALDVVVDGRPLFTSVQATWNPLEPSAAAALAEAHDAGARVIVKEVLANGRLAPGGVDDDPRVLPVHRVAGRLGVGVDVLATAAAMAQPWAWRVLSGAVTSEELRSNASAAGLDVTEDDLAELATAAQPAAEYWEARSRRAWT